MIKKLVLSLVVFVGISFLIEEDELYNEKDGVVLDGIDVVSILNNKPVKGNKQWNLKHKGLTYYFASKENKSTFETNADKYIPAFGGWCAYALIEKPQKVDVNPKTYKIVNGRLLLFYNSWGINTLEKWNALNDDSGNYKLAAENWAKLKAGK